MNISKSTLPIGPLRGRRIDGLWKQSFRFAWGEEKQYAFEGFTFIRQATQGTQSKIKQVTSFFASASYFRSACRLLLRDGINKNQHLGKINRTQWIKAINPNDVKSAKQKIGTLLHNTSSPLNKANDMNNALTALAFFCKIYEDLLKDSSSLGVDVPLKLYEFITSSQKGDWDPVAELIILRLFSSAITSPNFFGQLLLNFQAFLVNPKINQLFMDIAQNHKIIIYEIFMPATYNTESGWQVNTGTDILNEKQFPCNDVRLLALHAANWNKSFVPQTDLVTLAFDEYPPLAEAAGNILLDAIVYNKKLISKIILIKEEKDSIQRRETKLLQAVADKYGRLFVLQNALLFPLTDNYLPAIIHSFNLAFGDDFYRDIHTLIGESEDNEIIKGCLLIIAHSKKEQEFLPDMLKLLARVKDESLRNQTLQIIQKIEQEKIKEYIINFTENDVNQQASALELLADYPDESTFDLLKKTLQKEGTPLAVCRAACFSLLHMGRSNALRLVLAAVKENASFSSLFGDEAGNKPYHELSAAWEFFHGKRDTERILTMLKNHSLEDQPKCSEAFFLLAISDDDPTIRAVAAENFPFGYGYTYGWLSLISGNADDPLTYKAIVNSHSTPQHSRGIARLQEIINDNIDKNDELAQKRLEQALGAYAQLHQFDLMNAIVARSPKLRSVAVAKIKEHLQSLNSYSVFKALENIFNNFRRYDENNILIQALKDIRMKNIKKTNPYRIVLFRLDLNAVINNEHSHPNWKVFANNLLANLDANEA